jgi:prepilin-type N-terminal cleavage/methylation domain-containing protein
MERPDARSGENGFSLAEAVLVVAIIGVLAAIAVPSLIASFRAAREARALSNCRAVGSAQLSYYAGHSRFAIFDVLFRERYLGESFDRQVAGSGPSEIISDTAYRYKITFGLIADGITVDADPEPRFGATHRWFRFRIGRVTSSRAGGEGTMYFAPAMSYAPSPPTSAYRLFSG